MAHRLCVSLNSRLESNKAEKDPVHQISRAAVERGGNNLNDFANFHTEPDSGQDQNLALPGFCNPSSLDLCKNWQLQDWFMVSRRLHYLIL